MDTKEIEWIKSVVQDAHNLQDDFFKYRLGTQQSLLQIQSSSFQNISGLSVTLIVLGLGTKTIKIDLFLILSLIFLGILLLLTSSWVREVVDKVDKSLLFEENSINSSVHNLSDKAIEALEKDNSQVPVSYIKTQVDNKIQVNEVSYAAEMFNFLFYVGFMFGIVSVLKLSENILYTVVYLVIILVFGASLAFTDWSTRAVGYISRKVERFVTKN